MAEIDGWPSIEDPIFKDWRNSPGAGGRGGIGGGGGTSGGGALALFGSGGGFASGGGGGEYGFRRRRRFDGPAYMPEGGGGYMTTAPEDAYGTSSVGAGGKPAAAPMGGISGFSGAGSREARLARIRQATGGAAPAANPMTTAQGDPRDIANTLRQLGIDAGYFSPEGSKGRIDALRAALNRKGQANRARALLMAKRYAPNDPRAQAFAALQSDINAGRSESDAVAEAINEMQGGNEQFFRNLYLQQLAHAYGWDRADQAGKINQWGKDSGGFDWSGFLGNAAGSAIKAGV